MLPFNVKRPPMGTFEERQGGGSKQRRFHNVARENRAGPHILRTHFHVVRGFLP